MDGNSRGEEMDDWRGDREETMSKHIISMFKIFKQ